MVLSGFTTGQGGMRATWQVRLEVRKSGPGEVGRGGLVTRWGDRRGVLSVTVNRSHQTAMSTALSFISASLQSDHTAV